MNNVKLLPWQHSLCQQLNQAITQEHLGQALLFDNEEADDSVVDWLIQRLMCQRQSSTPCGQCHACSMLAAGTHSDFFQLQPAGKNIGIDDVRKMGDWAVQKPRHGYVKVASIRNAELLTPAASNGLLKLLEEPRENTFFILVKPIQTVLLPTIMSRVTRFIIRPPTHHQALAWLSTQLSGYDSSLLSHALHWVSPGPRYILRFITEQHGDTSLKNFEQAIRQLRDNQTQPLIELITQNPNMIEWLTQIIIDSLKTELGFPTAYFTFDYLSESALIDVYQQIIEFQQHLNDTPGLNIALQLYPLLDRLTLSAEIRNAH
ncbi:hypothetical protein [Celerinatantimonas sp. YJH-8]|uniref:hypothetical protein n=1 Tax=Celerinatantimonas sp. YJH-8 TaxID=3228714 RepID=UPI0038C0558C